MGLRHIRMARAARAECDDTDPTRILVDTPELATCPICIARFEIRTKDWHHELAKTVRRPGGFGGKKKP